MTQIYISKKNHKKSHNKAAHVSHSHRHSHNPLSAFNYMPEKINFVAADSEEKIILLLRKHPITNLGWIINSMALIVAPLILTFILDTITQTVPVGFQIVGILGWYLVTLAFIFEKFLGWFFNVYIVTDERVFDVDFVHLTYREITDANLDQIQDVTSKIAGVFGTLINYGDVFIQTASATPQIEFEKVPNPDKVAAILRDLRVEEEREKLEGRVR